MTIKSINRSIRGTLKTEYKTPENKPPIMIINRSREYARKGYSTTDSLLYMLQAVYEAVDSAEASTRLFFTDFTKGLILFTTPLVQELAKLEVHPVLLKWITAFLTNR